MPFVRGLVSAGTERQRRHARAGSTDLSAGGTPRLRIPAFGTAGTNLDKLDLATAGGSLTLGGTAKLVLDLNGLASTGTATNIVTFNNASTCAGVFQSITLLNNPNRYIAVVTYSLNGSLSITLKLRGRPNNVGVGAPHAL